MRLISNRLYFDYNATSPLANSVKDFLGKGEFLFGNPSSIHSTGKHAKSFINETTNYLTNLFKLTSDQLIFYHSGASEGISTVIKGFAEEQIDRKRKICFIYGASDHVVATNLKSSLTLFKHKAIEFKIDKDGKIECITECERDHPTWSCQTKTEVSGRTRAERETQATAIGCETGLCPGASNVVCCERE